ncbi:MAG TPA: TIGR04211 family SH3 domain-containing protein [Steroidobacteraceae bacterium]
MSGAAARLLAAALLLGGAAARADTRYIVEQLVVALNAAPDGSGERVATLKSGDSVEFLERQGESAHVRLPSGKEGWVRASYLMSDPPLKERLATRTQELEEARKDNARLHDQLLAATAARPAPATASPAADGAAVESAPALLLAPPAAAAPGAGRWPLALGCTVIALLAGFWLGWRTLDRRIRRKYGGLRIY